MLMKPYSMDGLKLMKILDDFKSNTVITEGDYWNVIAFVTQRLLFGYRSLHTHGYSHNDMSEYTFYTQTRLAGV
jgi:hypothetical protein